MAEDPPLVTGHAAWAALAVPPAGYVFAREEGRLDPGEYRALRLHQVADDEAMAQLQPSSKLNTDPAFLQRLHALGHAAAERWWQAHRADVGVRGSLDIRRDVLGPQGEWKP